MPVYVYFAAFALLRDLDPALELFEPERRLGGGRSACAAWRRRRLPSRFDPAASGSPWIAARLSSSAAIRSGALVGFGSSETRLHDLLAPRLSLDQRHQLLAVLVAVLVGVEVGAQRLDQLLGHLELALGQLAAVLGDHVVELLRRDHLVGEAHRRHRQHLAHRADRGQVLAVSEHEPRHRHLLRVGHRLDQQGVGLLGPLVGPQVVGVVEVDRVDLVEIDEVLDLDRPRLLGVELLELLPGQNDVLLGRDLIALDDLLVGDLLAVGLGHPLVPDARAVARAQLAEAHRLARHGAVQLHGHVQEPEADRSAPNRPSHRSQPKDRRK